jgi:hypothetical protein
VTIVAVGIAALSSLTESWTLHDVHEPQSAKALITTSQRPISSGKQSASVRLILRSATSSKSPCRRLSRSPTNCRNLSALGLLLSSKPTRNPRSESCLRRARPVYLLAPTPTGLTISIDVLLMECLPIGRAGITNQ